MTITPYLLSDFGKSSIVPGNAMQRFIVDKKQNGIGYGLFGPRKGAEQHIIKYSFDVSNSDAKMNHITPISKMVITGSSTGTNPGHCESLEIYHRDGRTYLLMATKGGDRINAKKSQYGTQLTRIPIEQVDSGQTVPYDSLQRIGSTNWVGGSSLGLPARLELAVDSAEENIALWTFDKYSHSRIALYNLNTIHNLFDRANPEVTIKGTPYGAVSNFMTSTKADVFQTTSKSASCSLQGFALNNSGYAYVGCENGVGDPKTTAGAKGIWKFKIGKSDSGAPTRIYNKNWSNYTASAGTAKDPVGAEMESLQVVGGDLYMVVAYHHAVGGESVTEKNRLYHFDKTEV